MILQDLVTVQKGKKPPQVIHEQLEQSSGLILTPALRGEPITEFCLSFRGQVKAMTQDVLITWDGSVGKSFCGLEGTVGSTLAVLKIRNPETVLTRYLWHFLRTKESLLQKTSKGSSIPHVDPKVLGKIPVPTPAIPIQKRTVQLLDEAERALSARDAQLAALTELEASIYRETVEGISEFTTVEYVVGETGQMRTGPFGSQLLHAEFQDSGIAVLGIDNVVGNYFKWAQRRFISAEKYAELTRYTVLPGDVLVTIMGTIGECVVVPDGIETSINTKHLCAIRLDPSLCLAEYLRAALLYEPRVKKHLGKHAKGAIMSGLNMAIIKKAPLPRLAIDQQAKFEKLMKEVAYLRDSLLKAREVEFELFSALQRSSFSEDSL
jgi:type I restriction enzyme S subunit